MSLDGKPCFPIDQENKLEVCGAGKCAQGGLRWKHTSEMARVCPVPWEMPTTRTPLCSSTWRGMLTPRTPSAAEAGQPCRGRPHACSSPLRLMTAVWPLPQATMEGLRTQDPSLELPICAKSYYSSSCSLQFAMMIEHSVARHSYADLSCPCLKDAKIQDSSNDSAPMIFMCWLDLYEEEQVSMRKPS